MTFAEFAILLSEEIAPVVLIEGTRELPVTDVPRLAAVAAHLARTFPSARFRTGNAKGSDEAFAAGVASVDASRIEYFLPHAGHRRRQSLAESSATALDELSFSRLQDIVDATLKVSPQYERVAVNYRMAKMHPRQRAAAKLILRDTLKVTGTNEMQPPVAGIFYVNTADPARGGTGHTIRVCRAHGVPVITQWDWLKWSF